MRPTNPQPKSRRRMRLMNRRSHGTNRFAAKGNKAEGPASKIRPEVNEQWLPRAASRSNTHSIIRIFGAGMLRSFTYKLRARGEVW